MSMPMKIPFADAQIISIPLISKSFCRTMSKA